MKCIAALRDYVAEFAVDFCAQKHTAQPLDS
jgi:hypothetical protein